MRKTPAPPDSKVPFNLTGEDASIFKKIRAAFTSRAGFQPPATHIIRKAMVSLAKEEKIKL